MRVSLRIDLEPQLSDNALRLRALIGGDAKPGAAVFLVLRVAGVGGERPSAVDQKVCGSRARLGNEFIEVVRIRITVDIASEPLDRRTYAGRQRHLLASCRVHVKDDVEPSMQRH